MFVFENLLDLDDRGIQSLLREVQSESLIVALKGASEELREKIFKNMSQRAAEMLRDDLDAKGPVRLSEVESRAEGNPQDRAPPGRRRPDRARRQGRRCASSDPSIAPPDVAARSCRRGSAGSSPHSRRAKARAAIDGTPAAQRCGSARRARRRRPRRRLRRRAWPQAATERARLSSVLLATLGDMRRRTTSSSLCDEVLDLALVLARQLVGEALAVRRELVLPDRQRRAEAACRNRRSASSCCSIPATSSWSKRIARERTTLAARCAIVDDALDRARRLPRRDRAMRDRRDRCHALAPPARHAGTLR